MLWAAWNRERWVGLWQDSCFSRRPCCRSYLARSVPLGTPSTVRIDGTSTLCFGDEVVAEARLIEVSLRPPFIPDYSESIRTALRFVGFARHGFPGCFVCGTSRLEGDGLRILPGPVEPHDNAVAGPWTPDSSLVGADGFVRPEFIWSALDCPGAFALMGSQSNLWFLVEWLLACRRRSRPVSGAWCSHGGLASRARSKLPVRPSLGRAPPLSMWQTRSASTLPTPQMKFRSAS
jgi:hypothetical protein